MASPFETSASPDVVNIDLTRHPPNLPLGMLLAPGAGGPQHHNIAANPTASNVTLVAGWEHERNGGGGGKHLGPIQRSGLVRLGDRLVRINGRDVTDWSFREVMDALKELVTSPSASANATFGAANGKRRLKTLGFAPSGTPEWSRGTHHPPTTSMSDSLFFGLFNHLQQSSEDLVPSDHVVHSKRRYSFVSYIKGWRVAHHGSSTHEFIENNVHHEQERHQSENLRQQSDNSMSELERQLNKEPSMKYEGDPMDNGAQIVQSEPKEEISSTTTTSSQTVEQPYIQYEIQCHILFRNQSSFQSHTTHNPYGNTDNNNVHHSWSVWKRYTKFAILDDELRRDFGWQMDAFDDGRGIRLPSLHGLESWWYGMRNGGGMMTSLLGGSSGIAENAGGGETDAAGGGSMKDVAALVTIGNSDMNKAKSDYGARWGSSLYGMFRTSPDGSGDANAQANGTPNGSTPRNDHQNETNSNSQDDNAKANCPFPITFVEKRRKELSAYWTSLMRIEHIFEFGDVHSHKYSKTMASFLDLEKVLLLKKSTGSGLSPVVANVVGHHHHQQHPSAALGPKIGFPAINEDEEMYGSFRPSFASSTLQLPTGELSGLTTAATQEVSGLTIHDDDVSLLSDGTGAFGDVITHKMSHVRGGRPVVDIVPGRHLSKEIGATNITGDSSGDDEGNAGAVNSSQSIPEKQQVRLPSSSVATSSNANRNRRRAGPRAAAAPRAKPAFQRQFLPP